MKAFLLQWIGYFVLSFIYKTNKFEIHGEEHFQKAKNESRPILLCVWHGRMLFPIFYVIKNKIKTWALASPHQDGAIMGNILTKWGVKIITGSSNKQSDNAIQNMHKIFESDNQAIIAITNDGPKGPRHEAKIRSLEIAKKYNAQIITISGDATKKSILNTWDKFYFPKPFGRIVINIAPIYDLSQEKDLVSGVSKYTIECETLVSEKIK